MTDTKEHEEFPEYDSENEADATADQTSRPKPRPKGSYAGIQAAGFRDFLLKPEILRAVGDCGFEHPSEVQQECIPQAILGMDIICQAKSGMGKTAVFVLAVLQQLEPEDGVVDTLVLCHTRELAYQICQEFDRFSKHFDNVRTAVMFGGIREEQHIQMLQNDCPHIIVGTPGRILRLTNKGDLKLDKLKRFILDECDRMLESLDMRRDVQSIFRHTPHDKQVLMFSATIDAKMREVCRKFAQNPMEIFVDDESKLTLHGLQQHYVKLQESEKNRRLNDLLDALDFNQIVIFVKNKKRAKQLNKLLNDCAFPSLAIHSGLEQEERIRLYTKFKEYKARILVSTDLFGRGVDIERVNIVINYDMPDTNNYGRRGQWGAQQEPADPHKNTDAYLHRVGRAGRFGTKGLAITFVSSEQDSQTLEEIQKRFEVEIKLLPNNLDSSLYMTHS